MMAMVEAGEYSWKGDIISFTRKKGHYQKGFRQEGV